MLSLIALPQPTPAPAAADGAYRVGPGDVLEISLGARPELARLVTVQTTGAIRWPETGDVAVEGLTPAEIARRLTALPRPEKAAVTVAVKEYRSQSVSVQGEVQRPGRRAYRSGMRLLDLLLEAGGFTPGASGEVMVQRRDGTFADGSAVRRIQLERTGPTPEAVAGLQTVLSRDDVVTVAARRYVTVKGAVLRPGRYEVETRTTLTGAVSWAGGPTHEGSRVSVSRRDPVSGGLQTLRADLEAIAGGREPDLVLLPEDQVEVEAGSRS